MKLHCYIGNLSYFADGGLSIAMGLFSGIGTDHTTMQIGQANGNTKFVSNTIDPRTFFESTTNNFFLRRALV